MFADDTDLERTFGRDYTGCALYGAADTVDPESAAWTGAERVECRRVGASECPGGSSVVCECA